jgi:PAS domain-containing protein
MRQRLVQAFVSRNEAQAQVQLAELMQRLEGIGSLILTDRAANLWTRYPALPGLSGTNYAHRDWYKGASKGWKPYVSEVFTRVVGEKDLAVNLVVPLVDRQGDPIGLLAGTLRLAALGKIIDKVPLTKRVSVHVTDRRGQLLYSNRLPYREEIAPYPYFPTLSRTAPGDGQTMTIQEPDQTGGRITSPLRPRGAGRVRVRGADQPLDSHGLPAPFHAAGGHLPAALLLSAYILYMISRQAEARQARERLRADQELQKSESRYHELFNRHHSGVAVYEARDEGEDFILLALNEAGRRITGLKDDPVGRSVCEVFPGSESSASLLSSSRSGRQANQPPIRWATTRTASLPSGRTTMSISSPPRGGGHLRGRDGTKAGRDGTPEK